MQGCHQRNGYVCEDTHLSMKRTVRCLAARTDLEILGLTDAGRHYTPREIKEAFYRQAQMLHPDKEGGSEETFKALVASYESLTNRTSTVSRFDTYATSPEASDTGQDAGYQADQRTRYYREYETFRRQHQRERGEDAPNFSTWYFYRHGSSRQATGFTAEELRAAQRATRRYLAWRAVKSFLLLVGVLYLIYLYAKNDRLSLAKEARECNYGSASYWSAVDRDRAKADALRLPHHWTTVPPQELEQLRQRRLQRVRDSRDVGSSHNGDRPVAIRYKGRPFTPDGVRSIRDVSSGMETPQSTPSQDGASERK